MDTDWVNLVVAFGTLLAGIGAVAAFVLSTGALVVAILSWRAAHEANRLAAAPLKAGVESHPPGLVGGDQDLWYETTVINHGPATASRVSMAKHHRDGTWNAMGPGNSQLGRGECWFYETPPVDRANPITHFVLSWRDDTDVRHERTYRTGPLPPWPGPE